MSTRCITVFTDGPEELAVLYRHGDGYPKAHGAELKAAFGHCEIISGVREGTKHALANGMDCLAAQVVAHFKTAPGNFYLMPAGTRDVDEEFVYTLYCPEDTGPLHLTLQASYVTRLADTDAKRKHMPVLFDGPLCRFRPEVAASKYEKLRGSVPNDFMRSGNDQSTVVSKGVNHNERKNHE